MNIWSEGRSKRRADGNCTTILPTVSNQPAEQLGGVRETIGNYLQYFLTPEVAEVFCAKDSTFNTRPLTRAKSSS